MNLHQSFDNCYSRNCYDSYSYQCHQDLRLDLTCKQCTYGRCDHATNYQPKYDLPVLNTEKEYENTCADKRHEELGSIHRSDGLLVSV